MAGYNLIALAEELRQEEDWHRVRRFLMILENEAAEMDMETRLQLLPFCYDSLFHKKGAARRQASHTLGVLLSGTGAQAAKLWEQYLHQLLFVDKRLEEQQVQWLGFSLKKVIETTITQPGQTVGSDFLHDYVQHFGSVRWDRQTCIHLLCGILGLRHDTFTSLQRHEIVSFMRNFLSGTDVSLAALCLYILNGWKEEGWEPEENEARYLQLLSFSEEMPYCVVYLKDRLLGRGEPEDASDNRVLIQRNLQLDMDWPLIAAQLEIIKFRLKNLTGEESERALFEFAAHLLTVLRMNTHPIVFLGVGEELISLMPRLSKSQIYEICQEMFKTIELEADTSNYAATLLAEAFLCLDAEAMEEYVQRFLLLADSMQPGVVMTAMEAAARILKRAETRENLPGKELLAGAIRKGCVSYHESVAKECRFLVRTLSLAISLEAPEPKEGQPVAFYTDTFDPFTMRDRAIVQEILEMGYFVVLAADDFDLDKNPQPAAIRRQMLQLAAADLNDVRVLPEDMVINPFRPESMAQLDAMYEGHKVYLVTSVQEVEGAAGIAMSDRNHIVYSDFGAQNSVDRMTIRQILKGETLFLNLPAWYQNISQDSIRQMVQDGRDVNGLVDVQVQHMIRERNLYGNYTMYRKSAVTKASRVLLEEGRVRVEQIGGDPELWGEVTYHSSGKTAVITDIAGTVTEDTDGPMLALVELLAHCQKELYSHIVCFDADRFHSQLEPFGFVSMVEYENGMTLDMSDAIVAFMDSDTALKEPYNCDPEVQRVLQQNRKRLIHALTHLNPGHLVLALSTDILNDRLIRLVRENNPAGEKICVPFGKILKGALIPDTVTRELYTEKSYQPDMSSFEIREFPHYRSLSAQIRGVRSYGMPAMLVDDLFHKGYRFEKIKAIMDQEDLLLSGVVTGVISGKGQELAEKLGVSVEAVYTLPGMKSWLLETDLYPFVGGDSIEVEENRHRFGGALASINTIMPYELPTFFREVRPADIYRFSEICLENARLLYQALEKAYSRNTHRSLTMKRIPEVMAEPRYPSDISLEAYGSELVSTLLAGEEKRLRRLKM